MSEFKKNIEINVDDYIYFNRTHYSKFELRPKHAFVFSIALVLLFYIGTVIHNLSKDNNILFYISLFLAVVIVVFFVVWTAYFVLKFLMKIFNRFIYKSLFNKNVLFKNAEFTINEKGIHTFNEFISTSIVWSQILKVIENEHAFYLYYSKGQAFLFPCRYIESLDELQTFRNIIEHNTSKQITYRPLRKK